MRALFIAAAVAALGACGQQAATTEAPTTTVEATTPAPTPTVLVLTEADVRSQAEAAGYTNITGVTQNADGSWSATGSRDGATTQLTVGESGVQVVTTPTP